MQLTALAYDPDADTAATRTVAQHLADGLTGVGGTLGFAPDVRIWISGNCWWSGEMDLARAAAIQQLFHARFVPGTMRVEVHAVIADGNKAAMEMSITGTWFDGRRFDKALHVALDVVDGIIVGYREYGVDTEFFAAEPAPDWEVQRSVVSSA